MPSNHVGPLRSKRVRGCRAIHAACENLEHRILFSNFTVNNTNDSGTGSLRQAILNANAAGGTNRINFSRSLAIPLVGTINLASQLPIVTCNVTFSGAGQNLMVVNGNGFGTVFQFSPNLTVQFSGLRITGGHAFGGSTGGGISDPGGASASLTINSCTISGNSATTGGGGIYFGHYANTFAGSVTVNNSSIFQNSVTGGANINGGGIEWSGELTVSNSTITGNSATGSGGGLFGTHFGTGYIVNSTLNGNTSSGNGGALSGIGEDFVVSHSTISGNSSQSMGGGIYSGGYLKIDNCTLNGNSASTFGGAIFAASGSTGVYNCTISGNTALHTGGLYCGYGSVPAIVDTIIAANSGGDFSGNTETTPTGFNDLIGDGSDGGRFFHTLRGTQASPLSPMLAPLAFNGGASQTMALEAGSPAIGFAGSDNGISATDERGDGRPQSTNDIGAYQSGPLVVTTTNDAVIPVVNECSLRDAIEIAQQQVFAQTILFGPAVTGTINLVSQLPALTTNLNIDGGQPDTQLTVNGNNLGGVFTVNSGVTVQLEDLGIIGGQATAPSVGGGIDNNGTLTVINCSISGNTSTNGGGGIYSSGALTVINSTLTQNSAAGGGGMDAVSGTVQLVDCTISGNSAPLGAGVYITPGVTNDTINGTIIAANTGGDMTVFAAALNGSHDIIGDGSDGGILTGSFRGTAGAPLNPNLQALAYNGGFTSTMALFSGSPAVGRNIDFPFLDALGNDVTIFDGRGFPRNAGQGDDIGAYQSGPLAVNILTDPATEVYGQLSLREAMNVANDFGPPTTVSFAVGLTGTINTTGPLPPIFSDVAINGPGANIITVNGTRTDDLFSDPYTGSLEINDLTIHSGGITNYRNLTIGGTVYSGKISGYGNLIVGTPGHPARLNLEGNTGSSMQFSVTVNNGSTLDIANNTFLIDFGFSPFVDPDASIAADLATGYAGGKWNGTSGTSGAIISSTAQTTGGPALAVGINDGNIDSNGTAAPNEIKLKYTLSGDANLDGLVNFADLVNVVQNFNKAGTDWANGNFMYGNSTNFSDLVAVVQNFNKVLTPAGSSGELNGGTTQPLAVLASKPADGKTAQLAVNHYAPVEMAGEAKSVNSQEEDILQAGENTASTPLS